MENQENQKTEQQLIEEIRNLFNELVQEEKGRIVPGSYGVVRDPNGYFYAQKAKELAAKAHELEKLNPQYDAYFLDEIIRDEVKLVELYEYKWKKNKPTTKSLNKMEELMHNATERLQFNFLEVLGDIQW